MNTYKCRLVLLGAIHLPSLGQLLVELGKGENVQLKLSHEPKNKVDSNAVSVWYLGQRIGYLPNQGQFCVVCNKKSKKEFEKCKIGLCLFQDGGLATIVKNQLDIDNPVLCYATNYSEKGDGYQVSLEIIWYTPQIL